MMKWMREMLKPLNKVELATDARVVHFSWTKMARVKHAPTGPSGAAGGGERRCFMDSV